MAKSWMSNISDDLLSRLDSQSPSFPTSGFTGSASDFASCYPALPAPRREPLFVPTYTRTSLDDVRTIGRTRFGK